MLPQFVLQFHSSVFLVRAKDIRAMQTGSAIKFAKIKAEEEAEREVHRVGVAVAKMIEWGPMQVIHCIVLSKYQISTVRGHT